MKCARFVQSRLQKELSFAVSIYITLMKLSYNEIEWHKRRTSREISEL